MKYDHPIQTTDVDFTPAVARHSADQCVVYKTVEGSPLYLGYYFPQAHNKSHRRPAFVFIHGGSWSGKMIFPGQPHWQGDYLGYLARYYADRGFVCISIDYRLVRNCGQTAGYELLDSYGDCCDALDYILSHAGEYGIDPGRINLLGESAGGHLAGAVATFRYDRSYTFQNVFLINPITDLNDPKWMPYVPAESMHPHLRGLSMPEKIAFLSPLSQANASTSPTVILHGSADISVDPNHAQAFYEKMCALSNTCDLHILEQTHHAFLVPEYSSEHAACRLAISIISSYMQV